MKRFAVCIVLVALLVFVVGPVPARAATLTAPERQLLALIDHVRVEHGLCKLAVCNCLERAARSHSREMLNRGYFSHFSYNGDSFVERLVDFGFTMSGCTSWTAGENIAWGADGYGSPTAIFSAWMHSPPHRRVILCARFRKVGLGRAEGTFGGLCDVALFTLDCGARTW